MRGRSRKQATDTTWDTARKVRTNILSTKCIIDFPLFAGWKLFAELRYAQLRLPVIRRMASPPTLGLALGYQLSIGTLYEVVIWREGGASKPSDDDHTTNVMQSWKSTSPTVRPSHSFIDFRRLSWFSYASDAKAKICTIINIGEQQVLMILKPAGRRMNSYSVMLFLLGHGG